MFIERMRLFGFGRLAGQLTFDPGRCSVVLEDNEAGKSTLVDAIVYSFFNFPAGAGVRGDLRPREKYKPWGDAPPAQFTTELEMTDDEEQQLLLRSDFKLPQPFELTERRTGRKISLDGQTFGRRILRMSAASFTECFFFCEEGDAPAGRDELIRLIEEAAVSDRRSENSSIHRALTALGEARLQYEEFASGPLRVEALLARMDDRIDRVRARLEELRRAREAARPLLTETARLDEELALLETRIARAEYHCLVAENREIGELLQRHEERETQVRRRAERLEALKPYAGYDLSMLPRAQQLWSQREALNERAEEQLSHLERRVVEPLRAIERETAGEAPALLTMPRAEIDHLRSLRMRFGELERDRQLRESEIRDLRKGLSGQGFAPERLDELASRFASLAPAARQTITDHDTLRLDLTTDLAAAEQAAAAAAAETAAARTMRERLSGRSNLAFIVASLFIVVGGSLLIINLHIYGLLLIILGAAAAAAALYLLHLTGQHHESELKPAIAAENAAAGDVHRLRRQLEESEQDYQEILREFKFSAEDAQLLKDSVGWQSQLAPLRSAENYRARIEAALAECEGDCRHLLAPVLPEFERRALSEASLDEAIRRIERAVESREERDRLRAEVHRLRVEIEAMSDQIARAERSLADILAVTEGTDGTLAERYKSYLEGCEQARLRESLAADSDSAELLAPEQRDELRLRREAIREQLDALRKGAGTTPPPPNRSRAALQAELEELRASREELRLKRLNLFNECDRAVEAWRHETPNLAEELERVEAMRAELEFFREALTIAHDELASIAQEVFTQWARAISRRANDVAPLLNPNYRRLEISSNLELSVFSDEAGRRLQPRELRHLSKGAREQLSLALRIAVSEYLSEHVGRIPFVFDEPFAHWDDERFLQGLRFLSELAARHQVILLSCHRQRFQWAAARDPELAERLNFCALDAVD